MVSQSILDTLTTIQDRVAERHGFSRLSDWADRHGSWERTIVRRGELLSFIVALAITETDEGLFEITALSGAESGPRYRRIDGGALHLDDPDEVTVRAAEIEAVVDAATIAALAVKPDQLSSTRESLRAAAPAA